MSDINQLISQATSSTHSLIERQQAFDELINRSHSMAYGCAYAVLGDFALAQDVTQEAFLVAWGQLDKLREPAAFPAWLRRLVLTQCNRLQRNRHPGFVAFEEIDEQAVDHAQPQTAMEGMEIRERVRATINRLPDHERMVVALFYFGGHSQPDIADFLELPLTTIKKRLHTARNRLRKEMADMVEDEMKFETLTDELTAQIEALREVARSGAIEKFNELLQQAADPQKLVAEMVRRGHFQRFTSVSRQALQVAQEAAATLGSATVEPVHLLLGLLQNDGIAGKMLAGAGLTASRVRREVSPLGEAIDRTDTTPQLSEQVKSVVQQAAVVARGLQHASNLPSDIQPEHLLIALAEHEDSMCTKLFRSQAITADRLRAQLANHYRTLQS